MEFYLEYLNFIKISSNRLDPNLQYNKSPENDKNRILIHYI